MFFLLFVPEYRGKETHCLVNADSNVILTTVVYLFKQNYALLIHCPLSVCLVSLSL